MPESNARSGRAYTRSLLHGTGLTRTTRGMGRMADLRGRWLNELAVGVQVPRAARHD